MSGNVILGLENQSFFDSYWVAIHFASGLLIGAAILYYWRKRHWSLTRTTYWRIGFSLLVVWEYLELMLRFLQAYTDRAKHVAATFIPETFFAPESLTNIVSDLAVGSIGLLLIYLWRYNRRRL